MNRTIYLKNLRALTLLLVGLMIIGSASEIDARGMRGGGGGRRPAARPASRPAPRPASRPASRPANRPSTTRPSNNNRSPSVSGLPDRSVRPATNPATRPAAPRPTPPRPRPVTAPAAARRPVPPAIRAGKPPARRAAARTRSHAALAGPRPARSAAASKRISIRAARGITVRSQLRPRCATVFSRSWWGARRPLWHHRWHYHNRYAWWYWWGWSNWDNVDDWVDDNDWDEGWDYEYDDNVVFDDEVVYINDDPVATAEDYVEIADELAGIAEPGEDEQIDWLSLGVFAMSASETDIDPRMMIQLVLAKDGRIGGTYYHVNTETAREVRGSLDKETQRIAFVIGDKSDDVIEVGLESLTRNESPLWVHFEKGTQTQTWTLIRLDPPQEAVAEKEKAAGGGGGEKPAEK